MDANYRKILSWGIHIIIALFLLAFFQFTYIGVLLQFMMIALFHIESLTTYIAVAAIPLSAIIFLTIRKKVSFSECILLIYLIAMIPVNSILWHIREEYRSTRIKSIQSILEQYRIQNRELPKDISDDPVLSDLSVGPFGMDRIKYVVDGLNYTISSEAVPMGLESYSSKNDFWEYE